MSGSLDTKLLAEGARSIGCALSGGQIDTLVAYLDLLVKWNSRINLVGRTAPDGMIARHLLDSLSVAAWVEGDRVLDLGSGAGLPGIPLAIAQPQRQFTLLESRARRAAFLEQARIVLPLGNVSVANERAENYGSATFDTVVVRAFGTLGTIAQVAGHLLKEKGIILAMKGEVTETEKGGVPDPLVIREIATVVVPHLSGPRNVVIMAMRP